MSSNAESFDKLVQIVAALRHPETGCPWDLEQDHRSLRPYLIEESYEAIEAIEDGNDKELCGELGDVLMQVVLHAQVASERGAFSIVEVIDAISEKMVRRHPHVFGEVNVSGSSEVVRNWEKIKIEERRAEPSSDAAKQSVLAGVTKSIPALIRAQRLGEKAAKVSFDWTSLGGVWDKVLEEVSELQAEINKTGQADLKSHSKPVSAELQSALEHEIGDLLFSLCQLSRWLGLGAEESLRSCCDRFTRRFQTLEQSTDRPLSELSEDELEAQWQKAKSRLRP